jgi:serine/threonine protein kinase
MVIVADQMDELKSNEGRALQAFEQICHGVSAIHASGCVHRDIKPFNALRFPDGSIRVADLGLSKVDPRDTTTLTQTSVLLGTRAYCAPEQLLPAGSRDADQRTDICQLGKTLYELLTGQSPALLDLTRLPNGLAHIIRKATKDNPDERYQSLGALMDAVEYYRLSKDPTQQPRQAFENLVGQAEELLKQRQYEHDNLKKMLDILSDGIPLDDKTIVSLFGTIPEKLLPPMAKELPDELEGCLRKYVDALDKYIGSYNFEYAELVADRMKLIFEATHNPELRKLAIIATMFAAIDLNRYAAMDVFDDMILRITPDDAVPTAEALRENGNRYKRLAARVPRDKLNAAIRAVRDEVLGEKSKPSSWEEI